MDSKGILGIGLALMLVAGTSMSMVSLAQAESKEGTKAEQEKKDIKQGDKPAEADSKKRGFKKGQKPTETMGTMGKEKKKDESKP